MASTEMAFGDRASPVRVGMGGGQQRQLAQRGIGEPCPNPVLLGGDRVRGGLGDREPTPEAGVLVVVIDQDRRPVLVVFQAVPAQRADLVRSPPGVDDQLHRDADLPARDGLLQQRELLAQLRHDLGR
ncbi:MAG: hypothetical protein ACRDR6_27320 [Pseudonocardiaceae bacterium]